jgi:hypothetical protein
MSRVIQGATMSQDTGNRSSRRVFLAQGAAAAAVGFTPAAVRNLMAQRAGVAIPTSQKRDVGHPSLLVPQPLRFGDITAGGDLAHRAAQNFTRLQSAIYRPPQLFNGQNVRAWPGDFEGRALLAITLLSRASGAEPDYFRAMVDEYSNHLNPQGLFGAAPDPHAINEQQLSGHGWFLRGLCEYYEWKRDPQTLTQIRAVVHNLALPLRGSYATYPIDPALRTRAAAPANPGAVDGQLNGQHGDWAVSSDTGCAFIFMDGLAHAWVVLKAAGAPEAAPLKALIDEAVERYLQVDLVAIKAQTHASLTGMRALLRVAGETGDARLLQEVEQRYRLYRTTAMTANYANTNWFGRQDSWTEPCAIIDSYMVAVQLWQHTGDAEYLEDAHLIWFNGVGRGLRGNGGFGTDTCAGYGSAWVKVRSYEANFCCTLRGGEGNARAAQYLYFARPAQAGKPAELIVPFFSDSEATIDLGHGPMKIQQKTIYPYAATVRFDIVSVAASRPITLRLFAPRWTTKSALTVNGKPVAIAHADGFLTAVITPKSGDQIYLERELLVAAYEPVNPAAMPGYYAFRAGPMLLGYTPPADASATLRSPDPAAVHIRRDATLVEVAGRYVDRETGISLSRINDLNESNATQRDPCPRQILFRG